MRGRTNITQRAVPYVNGDVIEAEVETGVVNVGDFVEYKTITQEQQITDAYQESLCEKITEHYKFILLYVKPNSVRFECYNLNDMSLRCYIVFTTGSTTRGAFDIIDESNILLSIYGIDGSSSSRCLYLTIENDEFVINQNEQILGGSFSVTKISNNRFVIGGNIPSNSHENIIYIYEYDYTNKSFAYISTKQINNTAIYSSGNYQYGKYLDENLFMYFKCYRFQSSGNDGVFCFLLSYDPLTDTISVIDSLQLQGTYATGYSKFFDFDENLVFNISYSNLTNTTGIINVIGYDSVNNRLEVKTQINPINTFNKAVFIRCISLFAQNKVIAQTGSSSATIFGLSIFTYDKENNQITISDELIISSDNNFRFVFSLYNQSDGVKTYYYMYNMSIYYTQILTYINSVLGKSIDKNYVKQYAGNNAIGFAKTSGTAGEDVRIYVPHQS